MIFKVSDSEKKKQTILLPGDESSILILVSKITTIS